MEALIKALSMGEVNYICDVYHDLYHDHDTDLASCPGSRYHDLYHDLYLDLYHDLYLDLYHNLYRDDHMIIIYYRLTTFICSPMKMQA
jgi:hypothetical protein